MDDIPEIDPAIPEPDFFDATAADEGDSSHPGPLVQDAAPLPPVLSASSILDSVTGVGQDLKYDDDLCEFNEFLIELEETTVPNNVTSEEVVENSSQQKTQNTDQAQSIGTEVSPVADEQKLTEENLKKMGAVTDTITIDGSTISSSGPNTPDSRAGSSVVRLSLPVPKITINSSSTKKKLLASPPRSLRGSANKEHTQRGKRKFSDDEEDYQPDEEDDKDEEFQIDKLKTRSGRQIRKSTRYDRDDEDFSAAGKRARNNGRMSRKVARYGCEDDDESEEGSVKIISEGEENSESEKPLFEAVKRKKRSKANYWTDDEGVTHFDDGSGNIIKLKRLSIKVTRLREEEIAKFTGGECVDDDDDVHNPFLLEVCIDNYRSAEEAVKGGAKRIELCSSLSEGGLTPTGGFLTLIKEKFPNIPVFVMIRPRGGDFVYSADEIEIMARDITHYKQMGADGFVFGLLTKDCQVDVQNCRLLKQMAFPLECTFHRAFDKVSKPFMALETIISMGFNRVLTSGQAVTAHAGIPLLKRLVEEGGSRIKILAGAGVNEKNVGEIIRRTGVTEVHGSASKLVASNMCAPGPSKSNKRGGHKSSGVKMGSTDDSFIKVTDSSVVTQIVRRGRKQMK